MHKENNKCRMSNMNSLSFLKTINLIYVCFALKDLQINDVMMHFKLKEHLINSVSICKPIIFFFKKAKYPKQRTSIAAPRLGSSARHSLQTDGLETSYKLAHLLYYSHMLIKQIPVILEKN